MSDTLWTSIRNQSGWIWALSEFKRNPARLDEVGERWGETPLHWASLCSIEAMEFLLLTKPSLLSAVDMENRTALDWAVEKIFFLKEELSLNSSKSSHFHGMLVAGLNCGLYLLHHIDKTGVNAECISGNASRLMQYALASGEHEIIQKIRGLLPEVASSILMSGLVGLWSRKADVEAFKRLIDHAVQLERPGFWNGRPLGLVVAHLWALGKITTERALWFHEAGWRLDEENEDESLEVFCSQVENFDMSKLSNLLEAI